MPWVMRVLKLPADGVVNSEPGRYDPLPRGCVQMGLFDFRPRALWASFGSGIVAIRLRTRRTGAR